MSSPRKSASPKKAKARKTAQHRNRSVSIAIYNSSKHTWRKSAMMILSSEITNFAVGVLKRAIELSKLDNDKTKTLFWESFVAAAQLQAAGKSAKIVDVLNKCNITEKNKDQRRFSSHWVSKAMKANSLCYRIANNVKLNAGEFILQLINGINQEIDSAFNALKTRGSIDGNARISSEILEYARQKGDLLHLILPGNVVLAKEPIPAPRKRVSKSPSSVKSPSKKSAGGKKKAKSPAKKKAKN